MPDENKIVLTFKKAYETKKKVRYDEEVGDVGWSEREVAIGYIYPFAEAMELIGNPDRIKVTIESV